MSKTKSKAMSYRILSFLCACIFTALCPLSFVQASAEENSTKDWVPGTSYSNSHSVNTDTSFLNTAEEAHGLYYYCQNSSSLPVQLYYAVYPHMETGVSITIDCEIDFSVTRKVLFWNPTSHYRTKVTYNDLCDGNPVTGHLDGPNANATATTTVYAFHDGSYGECTWTITGY